MLWLTVRQFRVQALTMAVLIAGAGLVLVVNRLTIADLYNQAGLATCTTHCTALANAFLNRARTGAAWLLYNLAIALLYLVPAAVGVFWGAPLVARELEAGTFRLVWTQSVSRTRWLSVKIVVIGVAAVVLVGLLSLVTSWSSGRLTSIAQNRMEPVYFAGSGIVTVGYALFGFALGVTVGLLARRTVLAMGTTLAAHAGVVVAMATLIRAHLLPPVVATTPLDLSDLQNVTIGQDRQITIVGTPDLPGAWILSSQTVGADGGAFTGTADAACGLQGSPQACTQWLSSLGLQERVTYQPAERFWALQWMEFSILIVLAMGILAFGFWWLRTKLH